MQRILASLFIILCWCIPALANDGNEPPTNPYLADSPWPMNHRNPYAQASSPYPGPKASLHGIDYLPGTPGLINMAVSGAYPGGSRVVWGNNITTVFKLDPSKRPWKVIDALTKTSSANEPTGLVERSISGAYTLVDRDGIFFVPSFTRIVAYGDSTPKDPRSKITIKRTYQIPAERLRSQADKIVGFSLTYDGMLAIATNTGLVGVISRQFDRAWYFELGTDDEISNSIACDEEGGIYVVTSKKMYRIQWTGSALTTDESRGGWVADYETGGDQSGIRLGAGSGTTPTLMGVGSQDKFVVITDGQPLMNLVLFWRDGIPDGWRQIPGTKDRRIAAQVPVRFGNPEAQQTQTEQSVCVRGYGAVVVSNQLGADLGDRSLNIIISGIPAVVPRGIEKFVWDPDTHRLSSAWADPTIAIPNGIPCMSSQTNLLYGIGKRGLFWTLEALDWDTGKQVFHAPYGLGPAFNSAYACTEIGLDGCIYSGTSLGMVRLRP